MFREITTELSARKSSILNAPESWHNVYFDQVTQRIDESVFEPLFNQGGRPNSPLRVLVGMIVLKEGNGWSDQQLLDPWRFNMRCMRALGLLHIDDDIPVMATSNYVYSPSLKVLKEFLTFCMLAVLIADLRNYA